MERTFRIDELAKEAGVSPRTVRYYLQRGLLAPPAFRGPDTRYDEGHLAALRAIRALQDAFLPLDAIAERVVGRSVAELEAVVEGAARPTQAPGLASGPAVADTGFRRVTKGGVTQSGALGGVAAAGETLTRHRLAPGVELLVGTSANQALVERILALVEGER